MKLMAIPVGRSLVFSGSQEKNISYSINHRQKKRILPKRYFGLYLLVGGRKRLVFSGSQVKNISYPTDHRQKIFRTLPITGNKIFVLYRSQAQNISYSIDHRQKIRILPKRYFGLYLLVGGRKRLVFSGSQVKIFRTLPITGKKYFVLYLSQAIKFSYSTENGGRSQTI